MIGGLGGKFDIAGQRPARRSALSGLLLVSSLAMFGAALVGPAPALDATRAPERVDAATLQMLRDPNAALRPGVASFHAGDSATSIEALRHAADSGVSLAQWKLARMYADGDGIAQDDARAFDYFSRLVEHYGDEEPDPRERPIAASAFVAVGVYLRDGVSTARIAPDPDRAFELFRYAATYFRDADAQYNLGRMYLDGVGVRRDARQGVNWLELAARKGHPRAQALLGRIMFNGAEGVTAQRARGLMFLTLARDAAAGSAADRSVIDLQAKALNDASDADRKAAVAMLEDYLRERD
jgi:TPR repeat protein